MLLEIPDQYADQAVEAIPRAIHNRFRGTRGWIQDIRVEKVPEKEEIETIPLITRIKEQ